MALHGSKGQTKVPERFFDSELLLASVTLFGDYNY